MYSFNRFKYRLHCRHNTTEWINQYSSDCKHEFIAQLPQKLVQVVPDLARKITNTTEESGIRLEQYRAPTDVPL